MDGNIRPRQLAFFALYEYGYRYEHIQEIFKERGIEMSIEKLRDWKRDYNAIFEGKVGEKKFEETRNFLNDIRDNMYNGYFHDRYLDDDDDD